jgi:hypothetical protein
VRSEEWVPTRAQTGHNLGMETTEHPKSRRVTLDDLQAELRKILRAGLPLSLEAAGHVLPNLRSVIARAVHPDDQVSRVDSLNTLLTRFIQDMADDRLGEPARIIFGLASGTGRTTLTSRRSAAAQWLGYDPDHFRKRVEPQVVRAVADLVYRDMLRYKTRVIGNLDTRPEGTTLTLSGDDFTAEEELVARVWAASFGLRAELIAAGRLQTHEGYETKVEMYRQAALAQAKTLMQLTAEYKRTYGPIIRLGNLEYRVEALASQSPPT